MKGSKFILVLLVSFLLLAKESSSIVTKTVGAVIDSLNPLDDGKADSNSKDLSPIDLLTNAINLIIPEVKVAMGRTPDIGKAATTPQEKMAVDDCKELFQYAVQDLQSSISIVTNSKLHTISFEIKNWLSAVISYQETCIDGFTTPALHKAIADNVLNSTKLTDKALGIVASVANVIDTLKAPIRNIAKGISDNLAGKDKSTDTATGKATGTGTTTTTTTISSQTTDTNNDQQGNLPEWLPPKDRKLLESGLQPTPNAVVAQDGSGQYKTISDAVAAYPKDLKEDARYVIYVKAGVYDETVTITKNMINVYMYGDGPKKTIVTGKKSYASGFSTFQTAPFIAIGAGFIAKSMGFSNTAGPEGHQAVALRVQSDRSAFFNCRMDGHQDTLYVQTHRQFYRNCVISGTVDFIFGDSAAVIQNCLIIVRKPMEGQQNTVTAQGRTREKETTGIVIQNCRIVPEQILEPERFKIPTYLGRPWKMYSRTIIMETMLSDFIQPAGWLPWAGDFALDTLYYREYNNRGPGAATDKRVNWKGYGVITNKDDAVQFTPGQFIQADQWLNPSGVPYTVGLVRN